MNRVVIESQFRGKLTVNELRANMVQVDADFSATLFKAKISNAEL